MLLDQTNKLYLTFVCPIIQNSETLNAAFQASNPDPTKIFAELEELRNFLLQKVYRNIQQRQFPWLLSDDKLGDKFEYDIKSSTLTSDKQLAIKQCCLDFMDEAINQIDKRIAKTTIKINYIKYLSPEKCLSQKKPRFCDLPLASLAREEGFDVQEVESQNEKKNPSEKLKRRIP